MKIAEILTESKVEAAEIKLAVKQRLSKLAKPIAAVTSRFAAITKNPNYNSSRLLSLADSIALAMTRAYDGIEADMKKRGLDVEEESEPYGDAGSHDVYGGFEAGINTSPETKVSVSFDVDEGGKMSVMFAVGKKSVKYSAKLDSVDQSAIEQKVAML